jgi:DNA-binding response OmpR family regulator
MRLRMRILIVEDELKMANLLRRGLVEEGHAVEARTRDDALWMAQAAGIDAIVLDLMLPGLRGKIDRPFGRDSLETVRGVGYRLRKEARS